ncbi:sigma-70 family RNA polymerase sigma factor [Kitasatospora sp. A2-31]|uniref:sigma-70 family RNA polymerase sigma factor n=1 Tax=Kitasatospora sp. A2-31 TaxID=2916414 RepID=UPI001EEC2591|nr:sigma-70 family RNA polymerase sigma factor [Kitasatospora sp. A2-31]MCG6498332.1 sigma-70 family RNA polymerase sigma factor [Kitasatospora sp. A2-31]
MARTRPATQRGAADEALIRTLYEQHGGALLAYAIRLTGDRAAAEDAVQETLIRAWRNPEALTEARGSVRSWLLTVERNLITDRFRARAARPVEVAEVSEQSATVPVQRDHAEGVVEALVMTEALEQLSPEHRDVLRSIYFQQLSVAEAAEQLGVPAGTVKSRAHYALRALKRSYAGKAGTLKEVAV